MDLKKSFKWKIEIIKSETKRGNFKSALFDFDGTLSLIRQGWREVMIPYFIDTLKKAPRAEDEQSIKILVENFVDFLTGKQTIYQCIRLDEEVQRRGGRHVDPNHRQSLLTNYRIFLCRDRECQRCWWFCCRSCYK